MHQVRFNFIEKVCENCVVKPKESKERIRSEKIDRILTGKYTAIPCFIGIMLAVFYLTFNVIGAGLQKLLEMGIDALTVQVGKLLTAANVNVVVKSLVMDGIFAGVGSVLSFLPIIVTLFFFLSLMEDSGYIARVAFVMDKLLRKIGLSGKSIVPMLIGFGCTVPAVMATRTLPSERDRKMTILLTPYMSCSAKLPIYAFFVSAFFPGKGGLILSDITDKKALENSVERAKKEFDDKLSYIMKTNTQSDEERNQIDTEKWTLITKAFSALTGLYTTIIDPVGKKMVEPAGPQKHMGYFYDMFEKPQYKQIYMKLNEVVLRNNVPVMMEMDDDITGSMICGAPIMIDGKHVATWICCSYDDEDAKKMESVYKVQWQLGRIFSEYAFSSQILAKEAIRAKSEEVIMENKLQWQKILLDALNTSDKSSQQVINDVIAQVGEVLNADVAALYVKDKQGDLDCQYIWSKNQSMSAEEYVTEWQRANMKFRSWQNGQGSGKLVDKGYESPQTRVAYSTSEGAV